MRRNTIFTVLIIFAVVFVVLFFVKLTSKPKNNLSDQYFDEAKTAYNNKKYDKAENLYKEILNKYKDYEKIPDVYYYLSLIYKQKKDFLKARTLLQNVIYDYSGSEIIKEAQKEIENLNMEILFSPIIDEDSMIYTVKRGDSLSKIASEYKTTVSLLKKSNNLENNVIKPDMKLKVITSKFSILVIKSQHMLALKLSDKILKTYNISVGRGELNDTPIGEFTIINKLENPTWFKNGKVIPAESQKNLLGSRWMGLSEKGYGIHGTRDPETIGQNITEGCIRMYDSQVEELYSIVPINTKVTIIE